MELDLYMELYIFSKLWVINIHPYILHVLFPYLLKASFQGFVLKKSHRTHQVPNKDEVPFCFKAKGCNIIEVGAFKP